jgi:hypothetical protein
MHAREDEASILDVDVFALPKRIIVFTLLSSMLLELIM